MPKEYIHKNLNPPQDMLEDFKYYNEESRVIVLKTQHGKLLSRYLGDEMPDARRFTFRTVFCPQHNTFQGDYAPIRAPADIEAFSHAVEKTQDPTDDILAGATTDMMGSATSNVHAKLITADAGMDVSALEQSGLKVGRAHIEGFSGTGGGFKVDGEGVSVVGGFNQPNTQKKGMTLESPLFGILPKTVVTFFASDYLPDIGTLLKIQKWVRIAIRMPDFYTLLDRFGDQTRAFRDLPDLPDADSRRREREREDLDDASSMPGYRNLDNPDRSVG